MTDLMVQAGVDKREKFTTIYSGMEVEPFRNAVEHRDRVRRELGYQPQHVVIGKVARLFRLKGHADVIEAARSVVRAQPNVRFLFVGDGILSQRLRARIAELGLEERFRFTGLVPPDRVPELIGAMDIVVHASLREGLARVLPQALIAGKPAISYDIDGAREVVLPGVTGILVPPQDVDGLGTAMGRLAADPALRQRMGAEGQGRWTDLFRHERMTASLRALYERLLTAVAQSPAIR
jgi:glycosyltransferase involved in cell wall biosynthesis